MQKFKQALAMLAYLSFNTAALQGQTKAQLPHASLSGQVVTLIPSGMFFRVPQSWLALYQKDSFNNLKLTREQLEQAKQPTSPARDARFAEVVNSILPFEKCSVQAGGDSRGVNRHDYTDVHMRVYVGNWSISTIGDLLLQRGLPIAERLATEAWKARARDMGTPAYKENDPRVPSEVSNKAGFNKETVGDWLRLRLSFPVWNVDVGDTDIVDLYCRTCDARTVVLVFMYPMGANQTVFIPSVVESFQLR
jgi:hypothetical protein